MGHSIPRADRCPCVLQPCHQLRWLWLWRRSVMVAAVFAALLVAWSSVLRLRLLLAPPRAMLLKPPRAKLLARPLPTRWNLTCPAQTEAEVATTAGAGSVERPSLEQLVNCTRRPPSPRQWQRWGSGYWVLTDWVPALHRPACLQDVTLTTQADLTYMPSLGPLVRRWRAPVSLALHAPGDDLEATLRSVAWARACAEPPLVARHVSFHLVVDSAHAPRPLPPPPDLAAVDAHDPPDCSPAAAPWLQVAAAGTYRWRRGLTYPINVVRNVARAAARTHFVLPSDIELLPSAGLSRAFLAMARRQPHLVHPQARRVFVLPPFEVALGVQPPDNKTQLVAQLRSGDAAPFHEHFCSPCHQIPRPQHWLCAPQRPAGDLGVTTVTKIGPSTNVWEPFYIGTHREPPYDERLSWEGMRNRPVQMSIMRLLDYKLCCLLLQTYILCLLDYEFHVLDNAFLVHQPGVKAPQREMWRDPFRSKNNAVIESTIKPEIKKLYGNRKNCQF